MTDLELVALAGLLHDVGEFLHRGTSHRGAHPKVSATFVEGLPTAIGDFLGADKEALALLVKCHHQRTDPRHEDCRPDAISDPRLRLLATIVSYADNYSSLERDDADRKPTGPTTPLDLVFSQVKLAHDDTPPEWCYPIETAGPRVKPEERPAFGIKDIKGRAERRKDIENLVQGFLEEVGGITPASFHDLYTSLLTLLHKYTAFIPSDTTRELASISLYDHLRTTSVIAACMYLYHAETDSLSEEGVRNCQAERFCLFAGHIGGIQNYIFDIAKITGEGGVAKRLRARSLFVQLLSDVASYALVRDLDLPVGNVIMSSGGKFYVLAPSTKSQCFPPYPGTSMHGWLTGSMASWC